MLYTTPMRFIGIDFGTKRVGVAISDEEGKFAFPHVILENNEKLTKEVVKICEENNISEMVIGESLDENGKPNKVMEYINDFVGVLSFEIGIPINFEKEFMTSFEAQRSHFDTRAPKSRAPIKKKHLDDSAAALILQRYLDRRNAK